jgi:hypothetical protein
MDSFPVARHHTVGDSALPTPASLTSTHDLVGVGIGPANLSLAALLSRVPDLKDRFLDARPEFDWHPGLMLPNSTINTRRSGLKRARRVEPTPTRSRRRQGTSAVGAA